MIMGKQPFADVPCPAMIDLIMVLAEQLAMRPLLGSDEGPITGLTIMTERENLCLPRRTRPLYTAAIVR